MNYLVCLSFKAVEKQCGQVPAFEEQAAFWRTVLQVPG